MGVGWGEVCWAGEGKTQENQGASGGDGYCEPEDRHGCNRDLLPDVILETDLVQLLSSPCSKLRAGPCSSGEEKGLQGYLWPAPVSP